MMMIPGDVVDFPEILAALGVQGARHLLTDLLCGIYSPLNDPDGTVTDANALRRYMADWLDRWPNVEGEKGWPGQ